MRTNQRNAADKNAGFCHPEETAELLTVTISRKITEDELKSFQSSLQQKSKGGESFNALVNVESFDGMEFGAIDDVVSGDKGNFERVAIVGDGNLEKCVSKVAEPFFDAEIKHFKTAEGASARQWVGKDKEGAPKQGASK